MKTITTTSTMQITRVRSAYPQAADRSLAVSVRDGFCVSMHESATSQAPAKDVSYRRFRRPPV